MNVQEDGIELREKIEYYSVSLGIDLFAVAPIEIYSEYLDETQKRLQETQATLDDYMVNRRNTNFFTALSSPKETLPSGKSIILLGVYAYDEKSDYKSCYKEQRCKTARTYSYYPVIRQLTQKLTGYIEGLGYEAVEGQNIPLKYVADRIGLGSYGKNGLLLTKQFGSFLTLRSVITSAPLDPDSFTNDDFCKNCNACLKACPTKALYAPYKVNPRLCLNPVGRKDEYIEPQMRKKMRTWLRGCDICQEVCPINRQLVPRKVHPFSGFDSSKHESHADLDGLEKCPEARELIRKEYPKTIRRNAVIALANMGKFDDLLIQELHKHMADTDEDLKTYFAWAIEELSSIAGN